jgi:hypothetical protein
LKNFTIGYINHDPLIHDKFLGPSIENLEGDFDIIYTSDELLPAQNYNKIISETKTPYLILTHQDVSFSSDLLFCIEETIKRLDSVWGALGMVGVTKHGEYKWSKEDESSLVNTLDCCFVVIKTDTGILFDEKTFDDYHLYVEDYCAQLRSKSKLSFTIFINSSESPLSTVYSDEEKTYLRHHSATVAQRGYCWGRYREYRDRLEKKWPGIKTT